MLTLVKKSLLWLSMCGIAMLIVAEADAQNVNVCGKRYDFIAHLEKRHGEVPTSIGVASNGNLLEVLSNPKTHTWTILVTNPNEVSCVVAAGEAWERFELKPLARKQDAGH